MASDRPRDRDRRAPDPPPRDDLPPRAVLGAEALAALAVPARLALLNHILAVGPCTASECAPVVGESASNCSWHLRALEKVGLVERAPKAEGDGRTRPWRATAVGYQFAEETDEAPAERIARTALVGLVAEHANDLYRRYLEHRNALPDDWAKASGDFGYALDITADELADLLERVDALIRPYVSPVRTDPPEGSRVVQVTLRAFPNPHVLADLDE
jgi:predicted transcriptional regulator